MLQLEKLLEKVKAKKTLKLRKSKAKPKIYNNQKKKWLKFDINSTETSMAKSFDDLKSIKQELTKTATKS